MKQKTELDEFIENLKKIERKWQDIWEEKGVYNVEPREGKEKFYVTFPYPYLNGPLHLGHGFTSTKADITARYKRMKGYTSLFPFAFHATGEPIVGMAKRVKEKDPIQLKILKIAEVEDADIEKFTDPYNIVRYFMKRAEEDIRRLGMSVDWRRKFVTTELTPTYSKFIEWQYMRLMEKGYITKGTHPVIWCPSCKSPTGEHDRLEGDEATIVEYVLLKFDMDDAKIISATLRPETIYGVTNIFVRPDVIHVKARVDDEIWILTKNVVQKFKDQNHDVEIIEEFSGEKLVGKFVKNPVTGDMVPILPATFIDPDGGTGIVMSVPAHAPVDWAALKDLKNNKDILEKYNLDRNLIENIKPISLIKHPEFGEFPAVEIVEKMKIKDQKDPKLEEATKIIYKKEFHSGITKEIMQEFANKPVKEMKDLLVEEFVNKQKIATILYEPSDIVICRCGTRNHVKILKDQWFLKYSDPEWKALAKKCIDSMKFYPEDIRSAFNYTIEWLEDKACARRSGLGTKMPWDKEWIIETLSDSTIYMAYYIVSKYVNEGLINEKNTTLEFFDYVFLGKGDIEYVSKITGVDKKLLNRIRYDFEYFYPLDLRISGKDLVHNHLTFCVFHHVALFPEKYWPRSFGVNGYMTIEEMKMSKSKGRIISLRDMLNVYGADIMRGSLAAAGEGLTDGKLTESDIKSHAKWLKQVWDLVEHAEVNKESSRIDDWLISRLNKRLITITNALENIRTRTAFTEILYGILNDIKWYLKRNEGKKGPAFKLAIETLVKALAPFMPHSSEELWHILGHETLVIDESYPEPDEKLISEKFEKEEQYLQEIIEDVNNIKQVIKTGKIKSITLFVADEWKYELLKEVNKNKDLDSKELIRKLMQQTKFKKHGKKVPQLINKMKIASEYIVFDNPTDEKAFLDDALGFLRKHFGIAVNVTFEKDANNKKAALAEPGKPGIYIELEK